jgi:hypothetical protein
MPAPGHYKVYWRNPKTRNFEAIPGIHLVRGSLVVRIGWLAREIGGWKHVPAKWATEQTETAHWYTNVPGRDS